MAPVVTGNKARLNIKLCLIVLATVVVPNLNLKLLGSKDPSESSISKGKIF